MSVETPNYIKLAFIGTSCIGKTTLMEELKSRFATDSTVIFSEEAARIFFQNYTAINRFSVETQGQIQDLALFLEHQAHGKNPKIIFCDRSVVDAAVYTSARGDKIGALVLFNRVQAWLPTYHKFILLDPADVPYQQDEIRQEDEETRQKFHEEYLTFLSEMGVEFELLSGSVEERIRRVVEITEEALIIADWPKQA